MLIPVKEKSLVNSSELNHRILHRPFLFEKKCMPFESSLTSLAKDLPNRQKWEKKDPNTDRINAIFTFILVINV